MQTKLFRSRAARFAPWLLVAQGALAGAVSAAPPATAPGTSTALAPLVANKQIDAGDLSIGYAELGPAKGDVVILLHGWPYDINSYAEVAPALASRGYRVIVPHLRGYGSTRFRSTDTPRNGEPAALASDIVALMDGSSAPPSPATTGAHAPPTSSPRCGPSASRRWCR